jgi:hypothetical protein
MVFGTGCQVKSAARFHQQAEAGRCVPLEVTALASSAAPSNEGKGKLLTPQRWWNRAAMHVDFFCPDWLYWQWFIGILHEFKELPLKIAPRQ